MIAESESKSETKKFAKKLLGAWRENLLPGAEQMTSEEAEQMTSLLRALIGRQIYINCINTPKDSFQSKIFFLMTSFSSPRGLGGSFQAKNFSKFKSIVFFNLKAKNLHKNSKKFWATKKFLCKRNFL